MSVKKSARAAARAVKLFLQSGTYAQRSYIVDNDKKLIYLIVYKSACSSIMASVTGFKDASNYLRIHHSLGGRGVISQNIDPRDYKGYFSFTFVRNPLERLVSCYASKFVNDKKLLGQHDLKRLYFDRYLFGFLKKDRGFPGFVRRVVRIPAFLADRHFISQSYLITDRKGRKLVEYVGRFEQLPEAFDDIARKYSIAPLARYNATGKGNWMDYYDRDTAKMAVEYYKDDIAMFGYEEQARELLNYTQDKVNER
ncbi:MAG: sulfotransferase family 2 domain-containing protein [Clostridia bacterium]|nr:sulfotransferase family 2 domain-containing protein [Clostridia bacterium]